MKQYSPHINVYINTKQIDSCWDFISAFCFVYTTSSVVHHKQSHHSIIGHSFVNFCLKIHAHSLDGTFDTF